MYRSLIATVSLLTLLSAPALAATSTSNQPKPTQAISKVAPVKPAGKHTALRGAEKRRLAKTTERHSHKASAKPMPSKEMPKKSAG
jgi:hypothetical protein